MHLEGALGAVDLHLLRRQDRGDGVGDGAVAEATPATIPHLFEDRIETGGLLGVEAEGGGEVLDGVGLGHDRDGEQEESEGCEAHDVEREFVQRQRSGGVLS